MKHANTLAKAGHAATLDLALIGQSLTVQQVLVPGTSPEWARWLEEIGFIAGEQVMVMARAMPGGDPLVIRIGQSTFALRQAEAACIRVVPAGSPESVAALDCSSLEGSRA